MTGFVQIIEWKTSRIEEVQALAEQFRRERSGSGGPMRITVLADRDEPNAYYTIAEFADAEQAAANSARPETDQFAARMAELCDGPPTFRNTDVLQSDVFA